MDEDEVISMKTPAFKSKPRVSTFQPPISSPVPNLTSITPAEVERRFRRVDSDDESVAEISMEVGTSVEKKKLTEDFDSKDEVHLQLEKRMTELAVNLPVNSDKDKITSRKLDELSNSPNLHDQN
ncbi:hypothetical protein TrRE_jg1704 [Triparma retinervis]|uniref:Uncharacterized protein n=1 Tax=Triparma retinervis TaxID=2557542 RepID=A0A9W6ZIC0_9STRA|nr:hypothetical protein TrRE_jg1704 [Triparma retinervis]